MQRFRVRGTAAAIALSVSAGLAGGRATAWAGTGPTTAPAADAARQNADLRRRVDDMQRQLDALSHPVPPPPTAAATPSAPAATLGSFFLDNQPVGLPGDVTAGYKDGFYLHQGTEFSLVANGVFDVRYTYGNLTNKTDLTTTPLGARHSADTSGFNLFNGQLSLQGSLFKHGQSEAFFKAMGNFGTLAQPSGSTGGTFLVNELFGGYAVDDGLRFRVGAMITPISPLRADTDYGGLLFPDAPDEIGTQLPGFALGADVLGALADNTVSYDVMVNNGSNSNVLTNSTGVLSGRDNRVGVYTREQVCGSGHLNDFLDESDVTGHPHLVWVVGGGFGYESQNSATTAFPGPQTTLGLSGISSPTGVGFLPRQPLNGHTFRYVADARGKVQGFSFFGEALYQNYASDGRTIIAGYPRHSIGQIGYFAQAGYFLVPHHLEVGGRFGQLLTDGLRHEMDEYTFGVNYYLFGQNLKVQLAETYVPRQAALTNGNGLTLNTQDWITQVQAQFKF